MYSSIYTTCFENLNPSCCETVKLVKELSFGEEKTDFKEFVNKIYLNDHCLALPCKNVLVERGWVRKRGILGVN